MGGLTCTVSPKLSLMTLISVSVSEFKRSLLAQSKFRALATFLLVLSVELSVSCSLGITMDTVCGL